MNKTLSTILREKYLDYVNNYLTIAKFAEHNHISESEAKQALSLGKQVHESFIKDPVYFETTLQS